MCFASARTAERTAARDTVPTLAESCTTRRIGRELSRTRVGTGPSEPVDWLARVRGAGDADFADVIVETAIVGLHGSGYDPI